MKLQTSNQVQKKKKHFNKYVISKYTLLHYVRFRLLADSQFTGNKI